MATGPGERSPRRTRGRWTDAGIAFGAIAASLALILGLRLLARDGASAGRSVVASIPTPVVSPEQGCQNFARFWMDESGVGVDAETVEGISNCRQAADGTWFVPTGPNDPRLPNAPLLSNDEQAATATLRAALKDQIADLDALFPATLDRWLSQIHDVFTRPVTGQLREGYPTRTARGRYTRLSQAYLIDPDHRALADYVAWIMARRIRAYDDLEDACTSKPDLDYLATVCRGLEDTLSIRFIPYPWELNDRFLLDSYLASTIDRSRSGTPAPGATPPPPTG
jgi:hypothetical protein